MKKIIAVLIAALTISSFGLIANAETVYLLGDTDKSGEATLNQITGTDFCSTLAAFAAGVLNLRKIPNLRRKACYFRLKSVIRTNILNR